MPDQSDPKLQAQLDLLKSLFEDGTLSEEKYRARLNGLGVDPQSIFDQRGAQIEKQINVAGSYNVYTSPVPISSPTLDADTALARYLNHVIEANRRLQLQGIRSSTGLVSIELEEIYITLMATERRTAKGEEQWLNEMRQLAPGEAQRSLRLPSNRSHEAVQQVTVTIQQALHDHSRLIVLGDPGSGKTTLLKYLALTFARDPNGETELVTRRLQLQESRLPILLPLRDFAKHLQEQHLDSSTDGPRLLLDFLYKYFLNQEVPLPPRTFEDRLDRGDCLILLDGMDEVADMPTRYRIARLIEKFTVAYPQTRYVITSRIIGYVDSARLSQDYFVTTIRDFTWQDIKGFIAHWNHAIEVALAGAETAYAAREAKAKTEGLLSAIESNDRVRELAVNPLMLTVIALVQRYRAKLPERRAELYEEAVEVLLGQWDIAKGLESKIIIAGHELDSGDRRGLLEPIALWMMEQHVREIAQDELQRQLGSQFYSMVEDWYKAQQSVETFLQSIRERSGLLVERGQGIYAFSHLTFQEYLAARLLSARTDYLAYTLKSVGDSWWREVILLEVGCLSGQSNKERVSTLIRAIMRKGGNSTNYQNIVLAAECLRDAGPARVTGNLYGEIQHRLQADSVRPLPRSFWLLRFRTGSSRADIDRRIATAEALGRIEGGANVKPTFWTAPFGEPEWIDVPSGGFWMGGTGAYDGKPLHNNQLEPFKIAKIPITNAQYRIFLDASGYGTPWHWQDGRLPRGFETHPVVHVSWYDALRYCKWLSSVTGRTITLPSEAQWEKAARGDRDQRSYPWGDKWVQGKCNNSELQIGDTTPAGIFFEGSSPFGCLDMVGNVWEWTRSTSPIASGISLEGDYPYSSSDGRENLNLDQHHFIKRVIRGGSFTEDHDQARCAFRYADYPDIRFRNLGFRVIVDES